MLCFSWKFSLDFKFWKLMIIPIIKYTPWCSANNFHVRSSDKVSRVSQSGLWPGKSHYTSSLVSAGKYLYFKLFSIQFSCPMTIRDNNLHVKIKFHIVHKWKLFFFNFLIELLCIFKSTLKTLLRNRFLTFRRFDFCCRRLCLQFCSCIRATDKFSLAYLNICVCNIFLGCCIFNDFLFDFQKIIKYFNAGYMLAFIKCYLSFFLHSRRLIRVDSIFSYAISSL